MIALLPAIILFALNVFLFVREIKLDQKKQLENKRLANEHVLREVERFLALQAMKD
ncbi:MAG: hypothetical protein QM710_14300 [Flavobacterium sp.]